MLCGPRLFRLLAVILAASVFFFASSAHSRIQLTTEPRLVTNPTGNAPLSALLTIEADRPIIVTASASDGSRIRAFSSRGAARRVEMPIWGFGFGKEVTVSLQVLDERGRILRPARSLSFSTPEAPQVGLEWPELTFEVMQPNAVESGVTFASIRRRPIGRPHLLTRAQRRYAENFGLIVGYDEAGEVVWVYRSDVRIAGIQGMPNGQIMLTMRDQSVRIIDELGRVQREYYADGSPEVGARGVPIIGTQTLHHEPYYTSRGTFVSMSANAREVRNYYTSMIDPSAPRRSTMVMGDSLIEYDSEGNTIWRWDSWDHLDPLHPHFHSLQPYWHVRGFPGHADWTHGNGVTFDELRGTVIVSLKHLDSLVGIDYATGQIRWIYGDPQGWSGPLARRVLRPQGSFVRYPFSPHHPHTNADGTITYFDNGLLQASPFSGQEPVPPARNFGRGVEIRVNEEAMTFEEVWTSDVAVGPDSCYHWAMGEAERTPSQQNIVVYRAFCTPRDATLSDFDEFDYSRRFVDEAYYGARIDQYQRNGSALVSRMRIEDPSQVMQWQVYGGFFRTWP